MKKFKTGLTDYTGYSSDENSTATKDIYHVSALLQIQPSIIYVFKTLMDRIVQILSRDLFTNL